MAQGPDTIEVQQRPQVLTCGPGPITRRERTDRSVLEIGVPRTDPPGLVGGGPESPSSGSWAGLVGKSYEKYGLARQARDDLASCEKPYSIVVREGLERGIRFGKACQLALVSDAEHIAAEP